MELQESAFVFASSYISECINILLKEFVDDKGLVASLFTQEDEVINYHAARCKIVCQHILDIIRIESGANIISKKTENLLRRLYKKRRNAVKDILQEIKKNNSN